PHLLERALERLDELVRQLVDEADRVRDENDQALREAQAPNGGIQRREQPILDEDAGVRQPVHQRRLAGVRVADERDRRERDALALVAMQAPRPLDLVQALAE